MFLLNILVVLVIYVLLVIMILILLLLIVSLSSALKLLPSLSISSLTSLISSSSSLVTSSLSCNAYNDIDSEIENPYDKFMNLLGVNSNRNSITSIVLSDNKNILNDDDNDDNDDNSVILSDGSVMKLTDLKMIFGRLG